jgi:HEAT repeat protein
VIDLGTVPAREASDYLLSLATTLEGKPGREAILPAMLADSAAPANALLAIARDLRRPRDTRRSAMTWLGREAQRQPAEASRVVKELTTVARDQDDQQPVRSQALATLGRLGRGEGIPVLIELSNSAADPWLARNALQALARSGDPRARQALRAAVQRKDLGEEARVAAIRGLAQENATSKDAEFLRAQFPTLGERSREAVINALAEMGGSENARWLVSIARDEQQPVSIRRRALTSAQRAGTPVVDLVALYDTLREQELKEATLSVLAQSGTRAATDKLLTIARSDPNYQLRRRAVSQLSRSDDPRVRDALKEMVVK